MKDGNPGTPISRLAVCSGVRRERESHSAFPGATVTEQNHSNSRFPKSQAGEFGEKFIGGSEVEGVDAEAGCGEDIFAHVVDEHGFIGHGADFAQRVVIDHWRGLARSYAAGVDARGEVAHKRVSGLDMGHVDGVGIRKQGEAAFCCEAFEQEVRQNRLRDRGRYSRSRRILQSRRKNGVFWRGARASRAASSGLPANPASADPLPVPAGPADGTGRRDLPSAPMERDRSTRMMTRPTSKITARGALSMERT